MLQGFKVCESFDGVYVYVCMVVCILDVLTFQPCWYNIGYSIVYLYSLCVVASYGNPSLQYASWL